MKTLKFAVVVTIPTGRAFVADQHRTTDYATTERRKARRFDTAEQADDLVQRMHRRMNDEPKCSLNVVHRVQFAEVVALR